METRSNVYGFSELDQDWKENTDVIDPDTVTSPDIMQQSRQVLETKADIIDLIDNGVQKKERIIQELDRPEKIVHTCIQELRIEGVLQVKD